MYYHVWFVTKYRRAILRGKIEKIVKQSFFEIIHNNQYNILEIETNLDHVHLLLETESNDKLAAVIRVLKTVSAKKTLAYLGRTGGNFWARRYGAREISAGEIGRMRKYIRNQKITPHLRAGNAGYRMRKRVEQGQSYA